MRTQGEMCNGVVGVEAENFEQLCFRWHGRNK
jgi:hypothetical protein